MKTLAKILPFVLISIIWLVFRYEPNAAFLGALTWIAASLHFLAARR